jgi:hypothetical protein
VPACPVALSSALLAALQEDPAERVDMQGLLAKLEAAADELADDACEDEDEEVDDGTEDEPAVAAPLAAGGTTVAEVPRRGDGRRSAGCRQSCGARGPGPR